MKWPEQKHRILRAATTSWNGRIDIESGNADVASKSRRGVHTNNGFIRHGAETRFS